LRAPNHEEEDSEEPLYHEVREVPGSSSQTERFEDIEAFHERLWTGWNFLGERETCRFDRNAVDGDLLPNEDALIEGVN
jgi:hypothetical protein